MVEIFAIALRDDTKSKLMSPFFQFRVDPELMPSASEAQT
jgi:hypothetical protein